METVLFAATFGSLFLAVAMSVIAWKHVRESRDRAAARVEALTALTFPEGLPASGRPAALSALDQEFVSEAIDQGAPLFGGRPVEQGATRRRWIALAGVGIVMVGIIGAYSLSHSLEPLSPPASATATVTGATPSVAPHDEPLELLSLRHTIDESGRLAVEGLVRNAAKAPPVRNLVAVVELFDRENRLVRTATKPFDDAVVEAGQQSTFHVAIPKAAGVARYRVEFRLNGRDAIAHVDHRNQGPGGPRSE